jgi:hypothetical protein
MWKLILVSVFLLACTAVMVQAQSEACPVIVEEALEPIGDLCNPLDRNSACYGARIVESTARVEPRPADFFAAPGDRSDLTQLSEIHPQPLDEIERTFGVAVLNAQANLPDTLPGQSVILLLMGDARLTNDVAEDSTQQLPFQSFYFLPGVGRSNCYEAEPMLTIQTPGNINVTIGFNGVDTEFSPGTLLTITPTVCTIHRGHIVRGVGENAAVLRANQTVDIRIEETGRIVVNNRRGISEREYQRGLQIQEAINALASANDWAEQFIAPPREAFAEEPGAIPQSPCDVQHTVAGGETLHQIAQQYDTSVLGIVEANQLANPRLIYVGQTLCIPNQGSGFQPLPAGQ